MKGANQKLEMSDKQKVEIVKEWKKAYSEALVKTLNPKGDVLQIGFDANSANQIQSFDPTSHTIIVSNPEDVKIALKWVETHPKCSIIQGDWKSALSKLKTYHTIFFNEPQASDTATVLNYLFSEEIMTEIAKTQEILKEMSEELAQIPVNYSDEQLEEFYKQIGQYNQEELASFFKKLVDNKNITEQQHHKIVKKYKLDSPDLKNNEASPLPPEPMLACLEECIKNHMVAGSRFSSDLHNVTSKYEDSQFFEKIITNPHLEYKESTVSLKIQNKNYDALLMSVEKK